jgi:hypothetical protein
MLLLGVNISSPDQNGGTQMGIALLVVQIYEAALMVGVTRAGNLVFIFPLCDALSGGRARSEYPTLRKEREGWGTLDW